MPLDPLPPLPESRIPPPWDHSTALAESIVRRIAERPLNHVDLLRIREVTDLRTWLGRLAPSDLEVAFADAKIRLHASEQKIADMQARMDAMQSELDAFRRMYGSTLK